MGYCAVKKNVSVFAFFVLFKNVKIVWPVLNMSSLIKQYLGVYSKAFTNVCRSCLLMETAGQRVLMSQMAYSDPRIKVFVLFFFRSRWYLYSDIIEAAFSSSVSENCIDEAQTNTRVPRHKDPPAGFTWTMFVQKNRVSSSSIVS